LMAIDFDNSVALGKRGSVGSSGFNKVLASNFYKS
jgi:hypothetical protein